MRPDEPPTTARVRLRLFYFRHGETLWSLSGRHTGVTDIPLTVHGETQARALRPWVGGIAFSHVLTSPRLRAHATCELAGLGGQAQIEPDLAEWNYGDYEGRRSVDICEQRPGWDIFRDCCPNGESPSAIGERIDRLIARLRTMDGRRRAVLAWPIWCGVRRAMDRAAGIRSPTFRGRPRVDERAELGPRSPRNSRPRPLERRRRADRRFPS